MVRNRKRPPLRVRALEIAGADLDGPKTSCMGKEEKRFHLNLNKKSNLRGRKVLKRRNILKVKVYQKGDHF